MDKPKVVIADTNFEYIKPLLLKFVTEFMNKIHIEIITDKEYFTQLFKKPQKVDILIVSEDMYNNELQRHDIAALFLMMEHYDNGETDNLDVNKIYKYTSVNEIFNEITGKSSVVINTEINAKKETQVIVVSSASGGTGKTTLAMGISSCMTRCFKKVLYINASRLQTFQYSFSDHTVLSSPEVYAKLTQPDEHIYQDIKHVIRKEQFSYLPAFKAALMSLGIEYSIYKDIILSAKKSTDFDYIIVDTDVAFDEDKARLFDIADRVLIVVKQNLSSVIATNILVSNINGISAEKYIFVCNDFEREKFNALTYSDAPHKITISDYVGHIENYDNRTIQDISGESDIQRIAYLLI